jgi:hypothetical protein
MLDWLNRNGQGIAAAFSALAVLVAVLGIVWQVRASDQGQRAQSARDIYREFVALTVNRPELAVTIWSETLTAERRAAYEAYVEYMLYTAEQVIGVDPAWSGPMRGWLEDHSGFLCGLDDVTGYTVAVQALIAEVKADACPG